MPDHLGRIVASKPNYEYRVMTEVGNQNGSTTILRRSEGPWTNRRHAEHFAASFKPPKFKRAWVERRAISAWEAI